MAEFDTDPGSSYEPPTKQPPWGLIAAVAAFIILGIFAFWVTREKKADVEHKAVLDAMDKELSAEEDTIKAEREKLMNLSHQVEVLRNSIQAGEVKVSKATVAQFNQLAAQQRAEREKYAQMADVYNKKVAEYQKLDQ
jgi:hypothetical protein